MEDISSYLQYIPEDKRKSFIDAITSGESSDGKPAGKGAGIGKFVQENIGGITQGAQGITELAFNLFGKSGVDKDKMGNQMSTDIYGRPVYSYENYQGSIDDIRERAKQEVGQSTLSGTMSGLKAGAAIGSIVPGLGTLVGGAVGAGAGAIGGFIGGKKRKKELNVEALSRADKLKDSTISFNNENENYFESTQADSINSYLLSERMRRIS
jgi:hypothetical protein